MKRKQIIGVLCIIMTAVAAVTAAAIIKAVKSRVTPAQSSKNDTEQNTPSQDNKTPDAAQNTGETTSPCTDVKPNNTDSETKVPTGKNDIVYNTTVVESYKDFALTKGMDAVSAYEYLDSFLSSKYSILVNKQNKVDPDYTPSDLVTPKGYQYKLESVAADSLVRMLADAKAAGYSDLILYSGYRAYASQKTKYETRVQKYLDQGNSNEKALELAGQYIAPPGSSEHHTGLAADVCSSKIVSGFGYLDDSFDKTGEFKWLAENCADYGFILRYRKDAQSLTGFLYEPWHYRYIGATHAKACTALNITYEEYRSMLVNLRDQAKTEAGV